MYDVITIGSATQDVFLRSKVWEVKEDTGSPTGFNACLPFGSKVPVEDLQVTTGGGATNAAVTFARMGGLRVGCVAAIGADDGAGSAVLRDLRRERVATPLIQQNPKRHTGFSVILLAGSGERTILVHRGASERINARATPWPRLRARWLYCSSVNGDLALIRKLLAHAETTHASVAWNPGAAEIAAGWTTIAPLARRTAVFSVNREEGAALTGLHPDDLNGILATLCSGVHNGRTRLGVVLVTDGSNGAYACNGAMTWHIASRNLDAVNTTGAGDAFCSAFVLGLDRISNLK
ncbi:carbohydrate kinase family protein, partial [Candidatus Uhrbacteria bacterium]|nr:carbohydrate kinase family protein [Candidatus Uhrbacteria bacterium]